jgi:hypothetical protein
VARGQPPVLEEEERERGERERERGTDARKSPLGQRFWTGDTFSMLASRIVQSVVSCTKISFIVV